MMFQALFPDCETNEIRISSNFHQIPSTSTVSCQCNRQFREHDFSDLKSSIYLVTYEKQMQIEENRPDIYTCKPSFLDKIVVMKQPTANISSNKQHIVSTIHFDVVFNSR